MNGSSKTYPPPPARTVDVAGAVGLRALTHPLPAGMRDGLPGEARRLARLTRVVMKAFELFGYERVQLPALEYSEVLEVGGRNLDPHSVLRFVEPETGEVVALRPDMTPQVARMVSTRLAEAPMPARLCYQGSVLRRRRERARNNQQIPQAGIELVGVSGPDGDLEVLQAAAAALTASGLRHFVVDLGHSNLAPSLLASVPRPRWPAILDALVLKDQAALARRAERAGLSGRTLAALVALPELHGGGEVWEKAQRLLAGTGAETPASELKSLWHVASSHRVGSEVTVDLGETWRFDYYTGPMFQLLAEGPGLPVGSGGRYDALYARFGTGHAAAGCAIDLDNLAWACRHGNVPETEPRRVLVSGTPQERERLVSGLRAAGIAAAPAPEQGKMAYARAWRYTHLLELTADGAVLTHVADAAKRSIQADATEIARALRSSRPD
ncbi:MAG TPA: ATP phosphoribosyltransferase regulatory subunit [Polyangiaceae bacterium]|nr:ATP phosphoribosyltransferase regulatory subunit [Polyangiaceae bacterium]